MNNSTNDWNTSSWIDLDLLNPVPNNFKEEILGISYGTLEYLKFPSTTVGKERDVTVWLPPGYDCSKRYPVLYLFHGFARDQTMWTARGDADIILGNMVAAGTAKEMITVMPNCRARQNDEPHPIDQWSRDHSQAFVTFVWELERDLIPFIHARYSVAEGRKNTAVAGFSMGGRVALHAGIALQNLIGYVGAICPAPGLFACESSFGLLEGGIFQSEDQLRLRPEYVNDTYLAIFAGKDDDAVLDFPKQYHNILLRNGCPHEAYCLAGGHWFSKVGVRALYHFSQKLFCPCHDRTSEATRT